MKVKVSLIILGILILIVLLYNQTELKSPSLVLDLPSTKMSLQIGSVNEGTRIGDFKCFPVSIDSKICQFQKLNNGAVLTVVLTINGQNIQTIHITALGEGSEFINETISVIQKLTIYREVVTKDISKFDESEKFIYKKNGKEVTITFTKRPKSQIIFMTSIYLTEVN